MQTPTCGAHLGRVPVDGDLRKELKQLLGAVGLGAAVREVHQTRVALKKPRGDVSRGEVGVRLSITMQAGYTCLK